MSKTVKCAYCGQEVMKDIAERYKDRNYHNHCCQLAKERDRVCNYICYLFDLKKPGPRNYTLIKRFIEDGYTYKGIFYSLKYFYEVKNGDTKKSKEAIGIVPYVYEEAQKYFEELEQNREKVKLAAQPKEDKIKVKIQSTGNRTVKKIDLESLLGE